VEVDVFCAFEGDRACPFVSGLFVVVNCDAFEGIREAEVHGAMLDGEEIVDTFVGGIDFSNTGAVSYLILLRMAFQAMGPPAQQMRYPERERNLNNSRGMPSATALPN
jgi:hypothetical protein